MVKKWTFIYGEYDQSIKFTELLSLLVNDTVKLEIVKGEDHHFSKMKMIS